MIHSKNLTVFLTLGILVLLPVTIVAVLNTRSNFSIAATCYDFDGDGVVDEDDAEIVADHFNQTEGDPGYDPKYDLNGDGAITAYDIIKMNSHMGETCPPTATFSASRTTINKGQSVTLSWSTYRASSVSISSVGSVAKSGSKVVKPSFTYTYTLKATGPGGTVRKSIKITVKVPSSSSPTTTTTTAAPTPPADPKSVTFLQLSFSPLPELSGKVDLAVSIERTKFKKTITISKGSTSVGLKIPEKMVKRNVSYVLSLKAAKVLNKRIRFKSISYKRSISIGKIYLGDLNNDNKINQTDLRTLVSNYSSQEVDVNFDGAPNSLDYSVVLTNLGKRGN